MKQRTSLVERVFKAVLLANNKVVEKMPDSTVDKIYKETVEVSKLLREDKAYRPQDKRLAKNARLTDKTVKVTPKRKKVNHKVLPEVNLNDAQSVIDYNKALEEATRNIKTLSWKEVKERQKAKIGKVDNSSLSKRFIPTKPMYN